MKKLTVIFGTLFFLVILSSCELVKNVTTRSNNIIGNPQFTGVRITSFEHFQMETKTDDYYYINGQKSPFIKDVTIEEYVSDDGINMTHYTLDYYLSRKTSCFYITTLVLVNELEEEYSDSSATCTDVEVQVSLSLAHTYKSGTINQGTKFTVNFYFIKELAEYKVIEYDWDNNKIDERTLDLTSAEHNLIMNEAFAYCKVIYQYAGANPETVLIDKAEIEKGYKELLYTVNNNDERQLIQITYTLGTFNAS